MSGPNTATLTNAGTATATASNLVQGVYTFRLTVTDNKGATGVDNMTVTVNASGTTTKVIKVNFYGGTTIYDNAEWNNWSSSVSKTFNALKYADGSVSTVNAVLGSSSGTIDNGATYGGTMAPPEVLRYANYGVKRTLTLSGLSTSKTYNLELYSSRNATGNSTIFTIGTTTITIVSDMNKTNKAAFTALAPNSAGQIIITLDKTGTYNFVNGFILSENSGTVEPNVAPTANAGADKSLTLPTNSTTLSGSGTDGDGTIAAYGWSQVSGPNTATLTNAGTATATASGLVQGVYTFRLTVTDNKGATGVDNMTVTVNASGTTTKVIKVNFYGGTTIYDNAEWNNWSSAVSKTFNALKYADGSVSSVNAALGSSNGTVDNGATYGGTMAPPEVLRYANYGVKRMLTLSGLSTSKTYNLELYSSRNATGNSTIFTIGTTTITIVSDMNKTNKAAFTALVPTSAGKIVINLDQTGTYNFVNGFILSENSGTSAILTKANVESVTSQKGDVGEAGLEIDASPNPSHNYFVVGFRSNDSKKPIRMQVSDNYGRIIEVKDRLMVGQKISIGGTYIPGIYVLKATQGNRMTTKKLMKVSD